MSKKRKYTSMKKWPKKKEETVPFSELLWPVKEIIFEGYRLIRNKRDNFIYRGYNIGREELATSPTPEERLKEKWLKNEEINNRTLLDNILAIVFQLGIEQGRRLERKNKMPQDVLELTLERRTQTIKDLKEQLQSFVKQEKEEEFPFETDNIDLEPLQ